MEYVGQTLRRLRVGAGLTAAQLAEGVGQSRSYVAGVEAKSVNPSAAFLASCEKYFGLSLGALSGTDDIRTGAVVPLVSAVLDSAQQLEAPKEARRTSKPLDKLRNEQQVREAVENMLSSPAPEGDASNNIVFVSLYNSFGCALPEWLSEAFAGALNHGWNIEHVLRLDLSADRAPSDIKSMINLLTTKGRYDALSSSDDCGFDVLAVPGRGAVFFTKAHGYVHDDLLDQHENMFLNHAKLIRRGSSRLFYRFRHRDPVENAKRYARVAEVQRSAGDYCEVTTRLSLFARPLPYWERDQDRRSRPSGWLNETAASLQSFEDDRAKHSYREITRKSSLERFCQTGRFEDVPDDREPVPPSERIMVLEHMIKLLTNCPGYDLRLDDSKATNGSWWCKDTDAGPVVFVYARGAKCESMHIEVTDEELAEHFKAQFELCWAALARGERDREDVIDWLRDQIQRVPEVRT